MYTCKKGEKVALMLGPLMGDGIVSMPIAQRLKEEGCKVTVFSDHLYALRDLYPDYKIRPFGKHLRKDSVGFDLLLYPHQKEWPYYGHKPRKGQVRITFREHKTFYQMKNIRELYREMCKEIFGFDEMKRECPLVLPKSAKKAKYTKRIVIHPTASERFKEWSKEQFVQLANELRGEGFEPVFILAPNEMKDWSAVEGATCLESLKDLAVFLYESRFFIGNDSGPGHLAAAVGTPMLTLFVRKKMMVRWSATEERQRVMLPWLHLPGHKMKSIYWRRFVSVRRCMRRFQRLLAKA